MAIRTLRRRKHQLRAVPVPIGGCSASAPALTALGTMVEVAFGAATFALQVPSVPTRTRTARPTGALLQNELVEFGGRHGPGWCRNRED